MKTRLAILLLSVFLLMGGLSYSYWGFASNNRLPALIGAAGCVVALTLATARRAAVR